MEGQPLSLLSSEKTHDLPFIPSGLPHGDKLVEDSDRFDMFCSGSDELIQDGSITYNCILSEWSVSLRVETPPPELTGGELFAWNMRTCNTMRTCNRGIPCGNTSCYLIPRDPPHLERLRNYCNRKCLTSTPCGGMCRLIDRSNMCSKLTACTKETWCGSPYCRHYYDSENTYVQNLCIGSLKCAGNTPCRSPVCRLRAPTDSH